ncbi:MAG TPA: hypothetical protein VFV86_11205, partial [Nitrososphaeraceae archaeon]|nr:hypothetical protein [Nitrososphaeraceae archaeon]
MKDRTGCGILEGGQDGSKGPLCGNAHFEGSFSAVIAKLLLLSALGSHMGIGAQFSSIRPSELLSIPS